LQDKEAAAKAKKEGAKALNTTLSADAHTTCIVLM
jgi:hypothetical protein